MITKLSYHNIIILIIPMVQIAVINSSMYNTESDERYH